jgi:hypothetical protein
MAVDAPSSFGALLRGWRLAAGLTQEALAEQAGLSARGIADLERACGGFHIRIPSSGSPRRCDWTSRAARG